MAKDSFERVKLWIKVLHNPRDIFKQEKGNASYKNSFINIISAAIIATIVKQDFGGIAATILSKPELLTKQLRTLGMHSTALSTGNIGLLMATDFIGFFIMATLGWFVGGWIVYRISKMFTEDAGELKTQLYLTTLFAPEFAVIVTIFSFIGITAIIPIAATVGHSIFTGAFYAWAILAFVAVLCNIYLYILALAEVHNYGEGTGIAVCGLGTIILFVLTIALILTTLSSFLAVLLI